MHVDIYPTEESVALGNGPSAVLARTAHIVQLWRNDDLDHWDTVRCTLSAVGFTWDECHKILSGLGLSTRKNHRWTDEEKALLADMYTSGVAWDDILAEFDMDGTVIRGMVGRLGLRRPPKDS